MDCLPFLQESLHTDSIFDHFQELNFCRPPITLQIKGG
jgi:hypothetical protein